MVTLREIQPGWTDRAVFVGQTGSGKSTLARYMLRTRKNRLVWALDVNHLLDWHLPSSEYPDGEYLEVTTIEELIEKQDYPRLLFHPALERMEDFEYFDLFFKTAYLKGNVTVYVDEAYAVTKMQTIPFYYKACLTRGRGKGIETWTSSQRPSSIPSFLLTESENFYIFRLRFPPDVKKMELMTGFEESEIRRLPKRYFNFENGQTSRTNLTLKIEE